MLALRHFPGFFALLRCCARGRARSGVFYPAVSSVTCKPSGRESWLASDWLLEFGSSLDLGAWNLDLIFRGSWISCQRILDQLNSSAVLARRCLRRNRPLH